MSIESDVGVPTIEYLRKNNRGRKRVVEIRVPFWCNGSFFIRKKSWISQVLGFPGRVFGFHPPVTLSHRLEAFGFAPMEARRLGAQSELVRALEELAVGYGLSVRTDKWGLVIFGDSAKVKRSQAPAMMAAAKAARILNSMQAVSAKSQTSYNTVIRWVMIPSAMAAVGALVFIESNPLLLLAFSPLAAPSLLIAPAILALLAGLPAFCLRSSPFTLPALRVSCLGLALTSVVTGIALAERIDSWAPREEFVVQFSGRLGQATGTKKKDRYYLQPDQPFRVAALDLDVSRIKIGRELYESLREQAAGDTGTFDVTIDKGVLGAPYAAQVKREPPIGE